MITFDDLDQAQEYLSKQSYVIDQAFCIHKPKPEWQPTSAERAALDHLTEEWGYSASFGY